MRNLRRSPWSRCLLDELSGMSDPADFQRAVSTVAQSDPLIKLLQQVKLGRINPQDQGLKAVTEAWLATYQKVLETYALERAMVRRLDPAPRIAVLVEAGILTGDHPGVAALQASFDAALDRASS